jgi:hypothetical protein
MKKSLIVLALVTGCGASDQSGNGSGADGNGAGVQAQSGMSTPASGSSGQSGSTALTGLYEGPAGEHTNQLCIIEKGSTAQFGITVWGPNMRNCSGAGEVQREGGRLLLRMTGDSSCAVEVKRQGTSLTLTGTPPPGCDYYCGKPTRFEGASFTRKGATAADAMKAKDMVGERLCG